MLCMSTAPVPGRVRHTDGSLGKKVIADGCPNIATHEVWLGGRFLGAYCALHDHSTRAVVNPPRSTPGSLRRGSVWVHDAHTGLCLGPASLELAKEKQLGVPFDVIDAGVKRKLLLRRRA